MDEPRSKTNAHCAFAGCTNNSRFTSSAIKFHPFAKPCQKVSQGIAEATQSHCSLCPTCSKCARWLSIGQGNKKWPNAITGIKKTHYICSLHFVNGHPFSSRFPDPLPATEAAALAMKTTQLSRKRQQNVLQENVTPLKKRFVDISPKPSDKSTVNNQEHVNLVQVEVKSPTTTTNLNLPHGVDEASQTNVVWSHFQKMKVENAKLRYENIALKTAVAQLKGTIKDGENFKQFIQSIETNEKKCKFYTNSTFPQIIAFLDFLSPYDKLHYWGEKDSVKCPSKRLYTPLQELILVLLRLRTGLLTQDLVYRFGMSQGSISKIVTTWVQHTYCKLNEINPTKFPLEDISKKSFPVKFKELKDLRVVIDSAELYCQTSANSGVS